FFYTNKVKGLSTDGDCTSPTAAVITGILTVNVTNSVPRFITQPTPAVQGVCIGSNATITALGSGCPSVAYQWWFNATTILVNATNASLTISNAQFANAGNYTVVLT